MKEGFTILEEIGVPSDFDHLSNIERLIDRICVVSGVNEDNYGNVLIAVTEAFNNAVTHGNNGDSSKEIHVSVAQNEKELCFVVKDQGSGFDSQNVTDPTAPENIEKENGRGIYLMRHLADEVHFENDGREVAIYFRRDA